MTSLVQVLITGVIFIRVIGIVQQFGFHTSVLILLSSQFTPHHTTCRQNKEQILIVLILRKINHAIRCPNNRHPTVSYCPPLPPFPSIIIITDQRAAVSPSFHQLFPDRGGAALSRPQACHGHPSRQVPVPAASPR